MTHCWPHAVALIARLLATGPSSPQRGPASKDRHVIIIATPESSRQIGLLGVGAYRPERAVTNDMICRSIESSDEWIYSRTGIRTRRFASTTESVSSMAVAASQAALSNAGVDGGEIDAVIVSTSTNFRQTPSCAPTVAAALGAHDVPAFDLATRCAGFGYALSVAAELVRGTGITKALIIGSENSLPQSI